MKAKTETETPFWAGSYVDTDQPGNPTLWMWDCGLCANNQYGLADEAAAEKFITEHAGRSHLGVPVRISKDT